jgi:uncharacterized protein YbaA (DUF1428 family)
MTHYIDGFVIPLPKNKIDDYRRIAQKAGEVWQDYGALEYRECVGEDLDVKSQVPFPHLINSTPDETVVLARIVFKSRAHRHKVNAKVMKDPRLAATDPNAMPFHCKRMAYGGFEVLVEPCYAADPVSVAVLLYCYSRSVHTFWFCHMLDRRMSSDRMRTLAAPLHYAAASIDDTLGPTPDWRH